MADTLIRPNSAHVLAIVNDAGVPEVGDLSNPSGHLSIDMFGNLRVVGVAGGIAANVAVTNGPGAAAVNIQDGGNSITVDGSVTQAQADTVPTQIIKLVALTTVPEAVAANGTFFKTALFIANKAFRTANTGKVWLGVTAVDGEQPIGMDAGTQRTIEAPEGQRYDLNDFYVDVETVNDGVLVIYS